MYIPVHVYDLWLLDIYEVLNGNQGKNQYNSLNHITNLCQFWLDNLSTYKLGFQC